MGERILIDTDVLIDYVKGKTDLPLENIYLISEITLYEFIRATKDPERAKELLSREFIIMWNDNEILETASHLYRKLSDDGLMIEDADVIIGATAISKKLKLYTNNKDHFKRLETFGLKFYE
ncbi:MAG: type II toxin-antitoxin system VapC family toxin [Candidatus Bathyarchaeia archaeon]|nr:type II toxin-antitoxin system VapC family toxin [Candidatus Bathyarchaeota archaeon]